MTETIIQATISIITFALGALVAFAQQSFQRSRESRKERFLNFYRPFMKINQFQYKADIMPFCEFEDEMKCDIISQLKEKDYLASKKIQKLMYNFIKTSFMPDDELSNEHKNLAFEVLYNATFLEYVSLAKKLNYEIYLPNE